MSTGGAPIRDYIKGEFGTLLVSCETDYGPVPSLLWDPPICYYTGDTVDILHAGLQRVTWDWEHSQPWGRALA